MTENSFGDGGAQPILSEDSQIFRETPWKGHLLLCIFRLYGIIDCHILNNTKIEQASADAQGSQASPELTFSGGRV